MSQLTFEELVAYFFQAQPEDQPYTELDLVRLVGELGLDGANGARREIVAQLAGGRRLHVIQAELAA